MNYVEMIKSFLENEEKNKIFADFCLKSCKVSVLDYDKCGKIIKIADETACDDNYTFLARHI